MMKTDLIQIFLVSIFAMSIYAAGKKEIQIGDSFTSPDKRFTAHIIDEDQHGFNMQIRNNRTGESYKSAASIPVLSFNWTIDSNTIVLIEHLSGGSQMTLIHFDGHKWGKPIEIDPPGGERGHYDVIREEVGKDSIRVTYKVTREKPNGMVIGAYISSFAVDPKTGQRSRVIQHDIGVDMYRRLKYEGNQ